MKKKKLISIILSGIFFVQGMMYVNHYSYGYHVDEVIEDLERLESIVNGEDLKGKLSASVLGALGAEETINETELLNLSQRILSSTEHAIENADDLKKVEQLEYAFSEINHIQEESLILFESALEVKELSELKNILSKARELKEDVNKASDKIQNALQNGKNTLELDIITSKEKHHHAKSHTNKHNDDTKEEVESSDKENILKKEIHVVNNATRREKEKQEDAIHREANRERILLIEKGKASQKSEALKKRMEQLQVKHQERERALK